MDRRGAEIVVTGAVALALIGLWLYVRGLHTPVPEAATEQEPKPKAGGDWLDNPFGDYDPALDGSSGRAISFDPSFYDVVVRPADAMFISHPSAGIDMPASGYATPSNTGCQGGCDKFLDTVGGIVNAMNQVTAATLAAIRAIADLPLPVPVTINFATKKPVFYRPASQADARIDVAHATGMPFV